MNARLLLDYCSYRGDNCWTLSNKQKNNGLTKTNNQTKYMVLCCVSYTNIHQQSEEEVVDHLPALKASCAKHCPAQKKQYDACVNRITKLGEGDCEAWYFDLLHCVDHCVAPQAFKKLK